MAEFTAEGSGKPPFGANPRKTGNAPPAQTEPRNRRADVFTLGETTYSFDRQQLSDALPVACALHAETYVTEISAELRDFYRLHSRTITQAPTGAGKTVALVRDILPHFAEHDRAAIPANSAKQSPTRGLSVLFVPTVALARQLRHDATCGRPPVMVGRTDRYDLQDALQTGYCIATYDQAEKLFPYISRCWVDEAHYLVSASGYRHKAVSALQRLIYEGVDVHLVSATPPPLYTQEDFQLCKITTARDSEGEKPPIQLQTMQSVTQYRQYALAYLAERVTLPDKALTVVLLNSTKSLAMLRDYLLQLSVLPESIALLTRDTKTDSPLFEALQNSAPVPDNLRFILATSVLECGVSLYAPGRAVELTHIENQPVQPTPERLLQFFARVRVSDTQRPESLSFRAFAPPGAVADNSKSDNSYTPALSELIGDYHLEKQFWSAQATLVDNYAARHARGSESVYVSEAYTPNARYLLDLTPQSSQPKHVPNQAAIMHMVTRGWHNRFTPNTLKVHLETVWEQPTDLTAADIPDSNRQAAEKELKDAHKAALVTASEQLATLIFEALTTPQTRIEDVLNLPRAAGQLGWCSVNQYYASSLELDHPSPQTMQLVQHFKSTPDLLEWFAQTCYALVRAKVTPTEALQLLLKSRRELHSKAEMSRRVQTFELQRLMFTPDYRLTTTSQNDKARLQKRLLHMTIGRTYSATQIQALVNREVGNRAKHLGKINAIRLVASLFVVEEQRTNKAKSYTITGHRTTEQTLAELCYPLEVHQESALNDFNTGRKVFEGERYPEKPMLTSRGHPPGDAPYRLTFRDDPPDDPPDPLSRSVDDSESWDDPPF